MPKYEFTMDDGRVGTYEAKDDADAERQWNFKVFPDMMRREGDVGGVVQDLPPAHASNAYPKTTPLPSPPPAAPFPDNPQPTLPPVKPHQKPVNKAQELERYSPASGMNIGEKLGAGAWGGLMAGQTGIKDLFGQASPKELEEREEWDKIKGPLGGWGTTGEVGGESLATWAEGGGASKLIGGAIGKVLPKSIELAKKGGKYINLGTFGRGAVQGGVTGGLVGESSDKDLLDRADDVAKGLGLGLGGPAMLKLAFLPVRIVKAAGGAAHGLLAPSATALEKKVYEAFESTIGKTGIADAFRALTNAGIPSIPQTTAAMAESPALGALERGARGRTLGGDFSAHDESVARAAWDILSDVPKRFRTEAGQVLKDTFMRNGIAQTEKVFGKGAEQVPVIESRPLRKALGELSPHLSDVEKDSFIKLSDDLLQKAAAEAGKGATTPSMGGMKHLVSAGLAAASLKFQSPALWKARSIFNTLTANSEDKVIRAMDEALLDPAKFMKLIEDIQTKVATDLPLTEGEKVLKFAIENAAMFGSRAAAAAPTTSPDKPAKGY